MNDSSEDYRVIDLLYSIAAARGPELARRLAMRVQADIGAQRFFPAALRGLK